VGRQEQVAAEGSHVAVGTAAAAEGGAGNGEAMVFDGIENPQPGIGGIARQQDHLDPPLGRQQRVDGEQLLNQRKGLARLQNLVFMLDLIFRIGFKSLILENRVAFTEVEQDP
jgi:hypothetical protein